MVPLGVGRIQEILNYCQRAIKRPVFTIEGSNFLGPQEHGMGWGHGRSCGGYFEI